MLRFISTSVGRWSMGAAFGAVALGACTPAPPPGQLALEEKYTRWHRYEGEPGATSFSSLDQINRSNVRDLRVAWTYPIESGSFPYNAIVVDSLIYVLGTENSVVALHAATGRELWRHVSEVPGAVSARGIMYWESEDRSERRLLFTKGAFHLLAVDAVTGEAIRSFGQNGAVDLRVGLGRDPSRISRATNSSPGVIFEDLVILGVAPGEGYTAGPGHTRAFDVRTGRQVWRFNTIPYPGEYGYDTWPEGAHERHGGANVWGGMSVDEVRGIVYLPLGSPTYDFYGVDRPGENLFGNSLVALNARTGERIWHFQTVRHDLWDYDLTATPVLLTVQQQGRARDIVALATKQGLLFTFDRVTGEPIWPIEERPFPGSEMPGEQAWPTQPIPTWPEPFVPLEFNESNLNPYLNPEDRQTVLDLLRNSLNQGLFTPPSTRPTIQTPGNRGGANWGSTAGDPRDGTFYVVAYNMPSVLQLFPIAPGEIGTGGSIIDRGQAIYQNSCQICHGPELAGQPVAGIPGLRGVTDRLSHDEFREIVHAGRGVMPGFPDLTPEEFAALNAYLANPDLALTPNVRANGERPTTGDMPLRYQSGWNHVLDSHGVPAIAPPWFRLTAYDMNDGSIKWQIPLGEVPHLAERGIRNTGSGLWVRGGPAATGGDLVFMSVRDRIVAYDKHDGRELWSDRLPTIGEGKPTVYEVNGRQFVVVSATSDPGNPGGGGPPPAGPVNRAYVAYALPREE